MKQLPESHENRNLPARPQYFEVPPPEFAEEQQPSLLLEYWHILRRRKGVVMLAAFVGLLAAILLTLPQTPVYQARTTVEIQGINENFLNMRDVTPTTPDAAYRPEQDIQTQIKILESRSLLERVIRKLNVAERLQMEPVNRISAWRKALNLAPPKPVSGEGLVSMAQDNLKVRASGMTRIIEISFDSTDPKLAAAFANTLAEEYIEQSLEARWKSSQRTGDWLTRQLEDLKIKLEKSEDDLQSYARATGLMYTSDKENVAEEKLRQLQAELSRASAERVARQSRYELATSSPADSLPDVLDDSSLREYQSKITDLRRQLAELTSSLTEAHPKVKRVQAQIATLEPVLERERANILKRIRNEFLAAQRREKLLAADYAAQSRLVSNQAAKAIHYNILKREVDTNRQLYESMLQKVKEAGIASALKASNIRIVDPAKAPLFPYKPKFLLNSALGLFAGLFLGVVFVVMRERADRTIQAPGDACFYLNVPELGVIPAAEAERGKRFAYYHSKGLLALDPAKNGNSQSVELATWRRKHSLVSESFRAALTSLLFTGENGGRPRVVVLTSPNPAEGKTTVASNLALAMAEINRRVLLIDADLRKPRLHEIFNVPNESGLSDLLLARKAPEAKDAVLVGTGYEELYLLPAGSADVSISSVLHSPRMRELVLRMREEFDAVLIDTPPMLHLPDARVLGRVADGVILVLRSGKTTRDETQAAGQRLMEDGTRLIGTILNAWDPRKANYAYGYGHHYRYYERQN